MVYFLMMSIAMKFCWANGVFFLVVFLLSVSSMLSSCGKTGDLYLPDSPSESQASK